MSNYTKPTTGTQLLFLPPVKRGRPKQTNGTSSNDTNGAQLPNKIRTVRVRLNKRSYEITVERSSLIRSGQLIANVINGKPQSDGRIAAVLTNPKVDHYYGNTLYKSLEDAGFTVLPISIPAGEVTKNLNTVRRIYDDLLARNADRRTILIAFGGGVIGDIGGFVAATYLRGIDLVQIPTTLLAQVDSSVGGKVGVNFGDSKNSVGAFYQPKLVIIDPDTLETLPFRERRSGLAEIIKYGAISDAKFYDMIVKNIESMLQLNSATLDSAISHSCYLKARTVERDELDNGDRANLNFGHTIGHALEAETKYRVYRHGEAVAIGMVSACYIGEELGITDPSMTRSLVNLLRQAKFPVEIDERRDIEGLIRLTVHDKKAVDGAARFVLLPEIGAATNGHVVPVDVIRTALTRQRHIG